MAAIKRLITVISFKNALFYEIAGFASSLRLVLCSADQIVLESVVNVTALIQQVDHFYFGFLERVSDVYSVCPTGYRIFFFLASYSLRRQNGSGI